MVSSPASLGAGASSGVSGSPCERFAASVARKSSASGPSRMLARLRATVHLLRQIAIRLGRGALGVVLEHGAALDRGLGVADRLADPRTVDEVAEVLLEDLYRLSRVQRAPVV